MGIILAEIPYVACILLDKENTDAGTWCGGGLVLALMFVVGKLRNVGCCTHEIKEEKAEVPKGEFRI